MGLWRQNDGKRMGSKMGGSYNYSLTPSLLKLLAFLTNTIVRCPVFLFPLKSNIVFLYLHTDTLVRIHVLRQAISRRDNK